MQGCDIMAAFKRSAILPDELEDTAPPQQAHTREPHCSSDLCHARFARFWFLEFLAGLFLVSSALAGSQSTPKPKIAYQKYKKSILDTCRSKPKITITKNNFWSARSGWQPEHQKTNNS